MTYLEYGFPDPYAECLEVETAAFLKTLIEWWELKHCIHVGIAVKN